MIEPFSYDVFLKPNQADKPRVRRLAERLRAAGPFKFETRNSEFGIPRLCLSPAALGSDWVGLACPAEACRRRRKRSTVLFRDLANAGHLFIPQHQGRDELQTNLPSFSWNRAGISYSSPVLNC